ncbi:hypothetical protein D3C84_821580 [compost metagenome]
MASTPNAGYTSDRPNPARPAPIRAKPVDGASHSSTRPAVSMLMQTIAEVNPPKRLMLEMNSSRARMKQTPNTVRQYAAPVQPRLT